MEKIRRRYWHGVRLFVFVCFEWRKQRNDSCGFVARWEQYFAQKTDTSDSRKDWFAVGEYKKLPNEVGGNDTTLPENVAGEIRKLLADYNALPSKIFEGIVAFHVSFERHPSRLGRKWLCRPPDPLQGVPEEQHRALYY